MARGSGGDVVRLIPFLLLAGCAAPVYVTILPNGMRVVEIEGACPLDYGYPVDGCFVAVSGVTFYAPKGDVRAHEFGHAKGGKHGPWKWDGYEQCSEVLDQGHSDWIVGNLICKRGDFHYQRPKKRG